MPRTMSIRDIENLRKLRTRAPKDLSVSSEVSAFARQIRSVSNRSTSAHEQWGSLLPSHLRDSHRQARLVRGVLNVTAASGAAAAALKQWLQTGGYSVVRSAITGVRAIKISTK